MADDTAPYRLRVGVVGYGPGDVFDPVVAAHLVDRALSALAASKPGARIEIVGDLCGAGMGGIGFLVAKERGYRTTGVGCECAKNRPVHPCDRAIVVTCDGTEDSAIAFAACIDVLVRVGDSDHARRRASAAMARALPTMEYEPAARKTLCDLTP